MINLPPRSLKSFLVSIAWVAWMLGRNPSLEIVCASYSEDLAHKFSRDCRVLMESRFYKRVFRTRLNPRKSSESEFETTKRGSRLATSIGATLTGRGADIFIIDDPTKANDAHSEVALEAANEWFRTTALNRRNNPAKTLMLVVQQRLHTNDLSGTLIERGWPKLVMPAIATEPQDYTIADDEEHFVSADDQLNVQLGSICRKPRKSLFIGDCVVGLGGLELPTKRLWYRWHVCSRVPPEFVNLDAPKTFPLGIKPLANN